MGSIRSVRGCYLLACVLGIAVATELNSFQPAQHATAASGGELGPAASVQTATECAAKCLEHSACISFNTNPGSSATLECQLNGYSRVWAANSVPAATFYQKLQPRDDTPFQQAVPWALNVPTGGVTLHSGPLRDAFDGGVKYLLQYSIDDLLWNFRKRAGVPQAPGAKCHGWDCREDWVEGSLAGLFLMGAGGHLRWQENTALREMMDHLIEGIENCTETDGYLAAFPQDKLNSSEHPDYTTSWTVHGFLEAAIGGNSKALTMIRKHMNVFNNHTLLPTFLPPDGGNWPWQLPEGPWPAGVDNKTLVGGPGTGHTIYLIAQGIIHNTRMALSPLGTQADVDLVRQLYQEDWWLRALNARDKQVIGRKLFDAHNYQLTAIEAYMDMYVLTGNETYLGAVMGAWEMHRDPLQGWIHVGGSIAINEGAIYDPGTYHLWTGTGASPQHKDWPTGEFCGAVFWLKLNQRMHRLWPENETFVAEMEREIYNEGLGHQDVAGNGIRYFSVLNGRKMHSTSVGTCCEGQGSRLYGSLNEYLFSTLPNGGGVYVDIYADSSIVATVGENVTALVTVITKWPYGNNFRVSVDVSSTVAFDLALRIPAWVEGMVMVFANEHSHAAYAGEPGTYLHINQTWKAGWSCLDFAMPAVVKAHHYTGVDQIQPFRRFSFTHGPTLLAVVGVWNSTLDVMRVSGVDPTRPLDWMIPHEGEPLHWTILGVPNALVVPAWEITDNKTFFSVYPAFD